MAAEHTTDFVSADERLYVRARVVLNVILLILLLPIFPGYEVDTAVAVGLVSITTLGTLYVLLAMRSGFVEWAMLHVVVPDLLTIAGYTYLLHGQEDAFYPAVAVLALAYALVVTEKQAMIIGSLCGLAYLIGHVYGHPADMAHTVFLAVKAASIPVAAGLVASSVRRRRKFELESVQAIKRTELLNEQMQRRVSELQAVSQITEMVHSSLDFERTGPRVLEILAKVIGVSACCLFVIDKEKSETIFSANTGIAGDLVGDAQLDVTLAEDHFSCVSVFDHNNIMVMFCASAEATESLSVEDDMVLGAVASELVVALENSRLYKLTKTLAVTDELTGLNNYRYLQQRLDEEIERSRRYGKRLSLLMIDVDDFKAFNDAHGHLAGDAALASLAHVMRSVVREVDTVARYGGEEFSIVLPETDAAGAFVAAEKVREAVANHGFNDEDGERCCRMTVSIGLATFPTHGWDKESLLREADDALYKAKSGGKNRVRAPLRRLQLDERPEPEPTAPPKIDDEWMGV